MDFKGHLFLAIAFSFTCTGLLYSQGDRCSTIQPFCAGNDQLVFPNSNSVNNDLLDAESGPNYDCLLTQPYPAWFYLQIADPGDLEFTIIQSQNPDGTGATFDVDFIVWGPFGEGDDFCSSSSLTIQNRVDCSYSPSAIERMRIPGALANEIYVVLITNFSAAPGYIGLQQTNTSGGSTDCSIVENPLGPDQQVCGDTPVVLDATNSSASEYVWFIFNETNDEYEVIQNETGPTLTVTETGKYQVTVISEILNDEASDEIIIEFFDIPSANASAGVVGCSTGGEVIYDLTNAEAELIGNNTGNYQVNFYTNTANYESGITITDPESFMGNQEFVLGTIVNENGGCESAPVQIPLKIGEGPNLEWNEITSGCVDLNGNFTSVVSIGTDLGPAYSYNWNIPNDPDGDGVQNPVLVLGDYPPNRSIILTVTEISSGCSTEFSTELMVFSPPRQVQVEYTGSDFDGGYTVTSTASGGFGDSTVYEYRLNEGPWQADPIFTGVPGGTYQVTAREINGCGMTSSNRFRLMGYPRFFTPNGDGYNDTWTIRNSDNFFLEKILIFDRYGKLLKQLNPSNSGWDGTFNGQLMPADDYWFLVEFRDSLMEGVQEFKGSFTLKR